MILVVISGLVSFFTKYNTIGETDQEPSQGAEIRNQMSGGRGQKKVRSDKFEVQS